MGKVGRQKLCGLHTNSLILEIEFALVAHHLKYKIYTILLYFKKAFAISDVSAAFMSLKRSADVNIGYHFIVSPFNDEKCSEDDEKLFFLQQHKKIQFIHFLPTFVLDDSQTLEYFPL